jgi:hypothetical protein
VDVRDVVLAADIGLAVAGRACFCCSHVQPGTPGSHVPSSAPVVLPGTMFAFPSGPVKKESGKPAGSGKGTEGSRDEVRGAGSMTLTTAVWALVALPEP